MINRQISFFYRKPSSIKIVRLLIPLTRFDTFSLSIFWLLPIYNDNTNQWILIRRNRLRKQIFPTLKIFFNPNIEKALNKFIQIIVLEKIYFKMVTNKIYNYLKQQYLNNKNDEFIYLPSSIQRKIYQQILKKCYKPTNFSAICFFIKHYHKIQMVNITKRSFYL